MSLPSIGFLHECFDYDPATGSLTWKERPRHHFSKDSIQTAWNGHHAGRPAAATLKGGRFKGSVIDNDGRLHDFAREHAIWKLMTGINPVRNIIFIDGDRKNTKWRNLKLGWTKGRRKKPLLDSFIHDRQDGPLPGEFNR